MGQVFTFARMGVVEYREKGTRVCKWKYRYYYYIVKGFNQNTVPSRSGWMVKSLVLRHDQSRVQTPQMLVDIWSESMWIKKAQLPSWPPGGQQVLHQRWIWGIHCMQAMKHASKGSSQLWNQGRHPKKSKTGVSVVPQKGLMSFKKFEKKKKFCKCSTRPRLRGYTRFTWMGMDNKSYFVFTLHENRTRTGTGNRTRTNGS